MDIAARAGVVALAGFGIARVSNSSCDGGDFCDDWGFEQVLAIPLAAYLIWNVLAVCIEVALLVDGRRGAGMVVCGTVVRLFWLGPLTVVGLRTWPWALVPLVLALVSVAGIVTSVRALFTDDPP